MRQLRIALTIAGAIALGAYEGGALAALLLAVQECCKGVRDSQEAPVRIDAIGCASAGAMTGVLAARTLLQGYDPIEMMYRAWVEDADVWKMLTANPHTLLSLAKLERMVTTMLQKPTRSGNPRAPDRETYHQDAMALAISLACLQGLDYQIRRLSDATDIEATTYVDWKQFTVKHIDGDQNLDPYVGNPDPPAGSAPISPKYTSLVAYAMASGANEFGFAPALLNRKADQKAYQRNGITHLYEWLWYTDGGTLDNEPLGRTLDVSDEIDGTIHPDGNFRRLQLLIHPHPDAPQHASIWTNRDRQPDWTATLAHSWQLVRSQHLYDDLRRMEKTNAHIAWTDQLETRLTALLDELEHHDPPTYEHWRTELASLADGIRHEKHGLSAAHQPHGARGGAVHTAHKEQPAVKDLVHQLVRDASGIGERKRVRAEVISPLLLLNGKRTTGVDQLLAGEILGSFGGFLDKTLRQSDFQLGFLSVLRWMQDIQQRDTHAPHVGERDAAYDGMLRAFVTAGLPVVEWQANDLVRRMHELDYLALPAWRRPFAHKPPAPSAPLPSAPRAQLTPAAQSRPAPAELATPTEAVAPQPGAAASGADQPRTPPDASPDAPSDAFAIAPAEPPQMELLYQTQGPRKLISLPAAWIMIPVLAIKIAGMFLYERALCSFPGRLITLIRRATRRRRATPSPNP